MGVRPALEEAAKCPGCCYLPAGGRRGSVSNETHGIAVLLQLLLIMESCPGVLLQNLLEFKGFLFLNSGRGRSFRKCSKDAQGSESRKRSLWICVKPQASDVLLIQPRWNVVGRGGARGVTKGLRAGELESHSWAPSQFCHCLAHAQCLHLQSGTRNRIPIVDLLEG